MNFRKILLMLSICFAGMVKGQDQQTLLESGKTYQIGGIEVTGNKRYSKENILASSGLSQGDYIKIPSEKFSNIIHKLWTYKIFSDIDIYIVRTEGEKVFLEIAIQETPVLTSVEIDGVKKKKAEDIIKDADLKKEVTKVNESLIAKTKNYIVNKYKKEGYYHTKVNIQTKPDTTSVNGVKMHINIDKGRKQKINSIEFQGNQMFADSKLQSKLKKTKKKKFLRFWKRSKYVRADFDEDLASLVDFYKENGYRDARITSDTVYGEKNGDLAVKIGVEEGKKYYFGDIKFLGNTVYKNEALKAMLGLKKGDTYNGVQLKKRTNDVSPDAPSIGNLYQNNGYLFSQVMPVETSVVNDTINFEIRIHEGKLAYLNNVTVNGNNVTNDKVIYREMRTRPGYKYSKDDIVRTLREISQLGFFDAQKITPEIKNPDPNNGTVDINWEVDDNTSSSQLQLQGGYGGGSFIGTVAVSISNFSVQNMFNKKAYRPFPMGDGQKVSLNLSASRSWRAFGFSFMEPWMGGERPVNFSVSFNHTKYYSYNYFTYDVDKSKYFLMTGVKLGLAKRLSVPDDYFQLAQYIGFEHYDLNNYNTGLFTFGNGDANSLNYTVSLGRHSSGPNPIYPMGGSDFNITLKTTLPYSWFNGKDYKDLSHKRALAVEDGNNAEVSRIDQKRFKWLEFYKLKGSAAWYLTLVDKLVLKTSAEFGILGAFNKDRGIVPFERFFVGGDGMAYYSYDGREYVQLRGYPNQSLSGQDGDVVYNKYTTEIRYPITLKPSASIYGLIFAEGGNSYDTYANFNPFKLKRSAGVGIRIFTPMFGTLGFDFGYGFDNARGIRGNRSGWETHFVFGVQP